MVVCQKERAVLNQREDAGVIFQRSCTCTPDFEFDRK